MAGIRWLETDTGTNVDISSAVACGAYTAAADRAVMAQTLVDAVAGDGDYVMYVTLQIGGTGSSYRILPQSTLTAASGLTAIGAQSGWINVRNGDVLTVYIDGLAGDTTTPDYTTRWFEDAALMPTTADRQLDVSATGEAGIDWANVGSPTTTVGLSGTTVGTLTNLPTMPADWITASGLKADAVTEIKTAIRSTAISESYPAVGEAPTPDQATLMILQWLFEKSVSGVTVTVNKLDGETEAMTFTLDAVSPSAITRAT